MPPFDLFAHPIDVKAGTIHGQAHGVGERVYLPCVVQTAQVIGLFVRDWCGLA